MNVHSMVSGFVGIINPPVDIVVRRSTGSTKSADYKRVPTYSAQETIAKVQLQPLSNDEIQQISGLNIQGEKKGIYLNGRLRAASRPDELGGDLVNLPDGSEWLVVHELEDFNLTAGWSKVVIRRQLP